MWRVEVEIAGVESEPKRERFAQRSDDMAYYAVARADWRP